jgi:hypothetical protein
LIGITGMVGGFPQSVMVSRKATAAGWCRWVKGPAAARADVTGRERRPEGSPCNWHADERDPANELRET